MKENYTKIHEIEENINDLYDILHKNKTFIKDLDNKYRKYERRSSKKSYYPLNSPRRSFKKTSAARSTRIGERKIPSFTPEQILSYINNITKKNEMIEENIFMLEEMIQLLYDEIGEIYILNDNYNGPL